MSDLVASLTDETTYPWGWHVSRFETAVLFFGRPIPEGPRTVSSHALMVYGSPADWHVDVLRYGPTPKALRVPGSMNWLELIDFITGLVPGLGGVSPLYFPIQSVYNR